jgi:hypothetical protein
MPPRVFRRVCFILYELRGGVLDVMIAFGRAVVFFLSFFTRVIWLLLSVRRIAAPDTGKAPSYQRLTRQMIEQY